MDEGKKKTSRVKKRDSLSLLTTGANRMSVNRMHIVNGLSADRIRSYLGGIPTNEIEAKIGVSAPWHLAMTHFTDYPISEDLLDCPFMGEIMFDVDVEHREYPCPVCGNPCKVKEYETRLYYHTRTLECKTVVRAKVPKLHCPEHGYPQLNVPWARPNATYTLFFEKAVFMELFEEGTVSSAARLLGTTNNIIGRVVEYRMKKALEGLDLSHVTTIYIDEVAWKKGHKYVTVFYDQNSKLIFCEEGKDSGTVRKFLDWFVAHGGDPAQIVNVSCDMGEAFPKGVNECFPDALITYDKFHVMKRLYEGFEDFMDSYGLEDRGIGWFRKKGYCIRTKLTEKDISKLDKLTVIYPDVGRNFRLFMMAASIYDFPDRESAERYLDLWNQDVQNHGAEPLKDAAKTIMSRKDGILQWYDSQINNGIVEGMNSQFKLLIRRCRGFANVQHVITMSYMLFSGLPLYFTDEELRCLNVRPGRSRGQASQGSEGGARTDRDRR